MVLHYLYVIRAVFNFVRSLETELVAFCNNITETGVAEVHSFAY